MTSLAYDTVVNKEFLELPWSWIVTAAGPT